MENDTPAKKNPGARAGGAARRGGRKAPPVAVEGQANAAVLDGDEAAEAAAPAGPTLRKKDLMERVGAISKAKKKDIKDVIDATLAVLGEAIAKGEGLMLPPLGKARITRQKDVKVGELYIIKLRRGAGGKGKTPTDDPEDPLADAAE